MAKMKKGFIYSIIAVAAIVIVASFHMQLGDMTNQNIPTSISDNILYVCSAKSSSWDSASAAFHMMSNYIIASFFFVVVLLAFGWGWHLYQNLLSDKFKRDDFKNIWLLTKITFWAGIIALIITMTPNHFRRVEITGYGDNWVFCDVETPGMTAVRADAVNAH